MTDRLTRLESELGELRRGLGEIERRLARLEEGRLASGTEADDRLGVPEGSEIEPATPDGVDSTRLVTLTGRTLLILGVAHLLRGLADSGVVPPAVGIGLGLIYALSWLLAVRRATARRRFKSAAAYGIAVSLIAFPLLGEAVTKFAVLSPAMGAASAATLGILLATLAARWRLFAVAWVGVAGALATGLALMAQSRVVVPCTFSVLVLTGFALWIGWTQRWPLLAWMTAGAANLVVLVTAIGVGMEQLHVSSTEGISVGLGLFALYLVSSIVRVRRLSPAEGSLSPFEFLQNNLALAMGYGGAVAVSKLTGEGTWFVVSISLVLIAGAYGSSFGRLAGGRLDRHSFSHFNTIALALVLASSWLALPTAWVVVLWSTLAVLGPLLGSRLGRFTFGLHGAVSVVGAAFASGLLAAATVAFGASPEGVLQLSIPTTGWLVLVAAAAGLACFRVAPADSGWRWPSGPRIAFWIVLLAGVGAALVRLGAPVIASGEAAEPNLASLRTGLLAATVTFLGLASQHRRFAEARWLVYPLLTVTAVKLFVQDFPHSRPTNLFLSLGFFGLALIVSARLVGKRTPRDPSPS